MTIKTGKQSYAIQNRIQDLFTGHRVDIDDSGRFLISPCLQTIKFTEIQTSKQIGSISVEESEEYVLTFDFKVDKLVVAYNSGLLRYYQVDILEDDDAEGENGGKDTEKKEKYSVETELVKTWKSMHNGPMCTVKIDTSNSLLATSAGDGKVKVWDIVNNHCTHNFKEATGVVSTITFSPKITSDSYHLLASGDNYDINVWNLIESKHITNLTGHSSKITSIVYTKDAQSFISACRDKLAIVWNATTLQKQRTIALYESIEAIQIVPRKRFTVIDKQATSSEFVLVTAGQSGFLKVWDYQTGNQLFEQKKSLLSIQNQNMKSDKKDKEDDKEGDKDQEEEEQEQQFTMITQLIYSRNLSQLVVVSYDKDIIFNSVKTLEPCRQLVGHNDEIFDIKYVGESEKHIAVATNSPKIKVFNLATSDCFILAGHKDIVLTLARFASRPNVLISSSKDNSVRVWQFNSDITDAVCLFHGTGHTHSVTSISTCFNDSVEQFFLSGSEDTTLKFWRLSSLDEEFTAEKESELLVSRFTQSCHDKAINSIDVAPNNQLVATGSQDKTAKIWSLPKLKLLGVIRGHKKSIWCVKFSPADQLLATASADSTIKLWSISNYSCFKTFQGHSSSVLRVAFIDQGMQLVSTASDGNLKIWNNKSGECVGTFDAHEGKVWALEVAKDEEQLVTGSDDSVISIWKNITDEVREKEDLKLKESIESEQNLANMMQRKNWMKALKIAVRLGHPLRCLNILKEILLEKGSVKGLVESLTDLRQDQLLDLFDYAVHWNTNGKHYIVAQCVVRAVLETVPYDQVSQLTDFRAKLEKMVPYAERHSERLVRLKQFSTFADFVYEHVKLPTQTDL